MHLYVIINGGKHNFCDLSPYTAFLVIAYLNHVFLYFTAVIGVAVKLAFSSQNLCDYSLLFIVWLYIL